MPYRNKSILFKKAAFVGDLSPDHCDEILLLLDDLRDNNSDFCLFKRTGAPNSTFNSFNFSRHGFFSKWGNKFEPLLNAFNKLLSIYIKLGLEIPYSSLEEKDNMPFDYPYHALPNIFEYSNPGNFDWHAHDGTYSKFQLVINLTKPGRDHKKTLFEVGITKQKSWKFTEENCNQGSIFSFPYSFPHRLDTLVPLESSSYLQRHVHLILPIAPLKPYREGFIPLPNWSPKPMPVTEEILDLR